MGLEAILLSPTTLPTSIWSILPSHWISSLSLLHLHITEFRIELLVICLLAVELLPNSTSSLPSAVTSETNILLKILQKNFFCCQYKARLPRAYNVFLAGPNILFPPLLQEYFLIHCFSYASLLTFHPKPCVLLPSIGPYFCLYYLYLECPLPITCTANSYSFLKFQL